MATDLKQRDKSIHIVASNYADNSSHSQKSGFWNPENLSFILPFPDNNQGILGINMVDEEQPSNGGDGPSQHDQLEQLAARSDLHARSLFHECDHKGSTEEALQRLDSQNLDFLAKDNMYGILYSLQQEQDKSAQIHSSPQQEHSNVASFIRCLTMLTVFTTLMALICFGTSMVAAQNSKDLTSSLGSSDFVLIDNESARMVTTPEKVVVHMNPIKEEISRRHLQAVEEAACHQEQYATDCAGSDWETTVVCEAVGTVDYDDATRLYQAFCPQYPDITDASQCANIGLSEVWLECGAGLTRILGGAYFPTAGTPGWDESETSFVFPTPAKLVEQPASLYFHGLQLVTQPSPTSDSSIVDGPTFDPPELCEESIQFKLYCTPTQENVEGGTSGTCFFLATYTTEPRKCPGGEVRLCRPPTSTIPSRRLGQRTHL